MPADRRDGELVERLMDGRHDEAIERVKVREVAGVFRSRETLDEAAEALGLAGFDRADIDLMGSIDAVREKLGDIYIPAEELADLPGAPRRAIIARDEARSALAAAVGLLSSIGALAGAFGVVASGGALALAIAGAAAGGVAAGSIAKLAGRLLGRESAEELATLMATGGLILWVRVRSPEREETAQKILRDHGAEAVRVHELLLEKRLEDLPLSRWLEDEPLDHP
jgi:hypothetical protein